MRLRETVLIPVTSASAAEGHPAEEQLLLEEQRPDIKFSDTPSKNSVTSTSQNIRAQFRAKVD
jgi:hypothetical protein